MAMEIDTQYIYIYYNYTQHVAQPIDDISPAHQVNPLPSVALLFQVSFQHFQSAIRSFEPLLSVGTLRTDQGFWPGTDWGKSLCFWKWWETPHEKTNSWSCSNLFLGKKKLKKGESQSWVALAAPHFWIRTSGRGGSGANGGSEKGWRFTDWKIW